VHLLLAWEENVKAFAEDYGGEVRVTRLAVTPTQITRLRLLTAPPKSTDKRAFTGRTCQAEAIPPDALARMVRRAIEARIDRAAYDAVLEQEQEIRRSLLNPCNRKGECHG
jgi:hypothetical protein